MNNISRVFYIVLSIVALGVLIHYTLKWTGEHQIEMVVGKKHPGKKYKYRVIGASEGNWYELARFQCDSFDLVSANEINVHVDGRTFYYTAPVIKVIEQE